MGQERLNAVVSWRPLIYSGSQKSSSIGVNEVTDFSRLTGREQNQKFFSILKSGSCSIQLLFLNQYSCMVCIAPEPAIMLM